MKRLMLVAIASLVASSSISAQQCCTQSCCSQYPVQSQGFTNVGSTVYSQGVPVMTSAQPVVQYQQPSAGEYYTTGSNMAYPNETVVAAPMQSAYPVMAEPGYTQASYLPESYNSTYVSTPTYSQPAYFGSGSMNQGMVQYQATAPQYNSAPAYTSLNAAGGYGSGLAQQKAQQAAQMRLQGHVGGGLGNAKFEGVGWSSGSAQDAIQRCCYWGTRPVSQIGVSRGQDGLWYACVLYQ